MPEAKFLEKHWSVRAFKTFLTIVALAYVFSFAWSIHFFPRIWGPLFHPETPSFLIMNLSIFLNGVLTALLYLMIIYQLYRLLELINKGEPFSRESPRRMRKIAYYTFGMAAIGVIMESVRPLAMHGISSEYTWPSIAMFILRAIQTSLFGLGILIMAFVLEAAVKLQQDQNLTI